MGEELVPASVEDASWDIFRVERRAALRELQRTSLAAQIQIGDPADVMRRAELTSE